MRYIAQWELHAFKIHVLKYSLQEHIQIKGHAVSIVERLPMRIQELG